MEHKKSRRAFLAILSGVGVMWAALVAAFPILKYLSFKSEGDMFGEDGLALVDKLTVEDVAKAGMGKNALCGGTGVIVFRNTEGILKAFNSKCTHAGCNVAYEGDRIFCNCHGGVYDLNGVNVAGPPPRPLTEYDVLVKDEQIFLAPKEAKKA